MKMSSQRDSVILTQQEEENVFLPKNLLSESQFEDHFQEELENYKGKSLNDVNTL